MLDDDFRLTWKDISTVRVTGEYVCVWDWHMHTYHMTCAVRCHTSHPYIESYDWFAGKARLKPNHDWLARWDFAMRKRRSRDVYCCQSRSLHVVGAAKHVECVSWWRWEACVVYNPDIVWYHRTVIPWCFHAVLIQPQRSQSVWLWYSGTILRDKTRRHDIACLYGSVWLWLCAH